MSMWFLKKSANDIGDDALVLPAHVAALMPAGFCYFSVNGQFDASPVFLKLLGVAGSPASIDALMESLPHKVADKLQHWLNGLGATTPNRMLLLEVLDTDQTGKNIREIELSAHWVAPIAGDQEARIIWAYDLTEPRRDIQRLKSENSKLKADVQQYSTILNVAPYPIWGRGEDMNLRYCNLRYSEMVEDIATREGEGIL